MLIDGINPSKFVRGFGIHEAKQETRSFVNETAQANSLEISGAYAKAGVDIVTGNSKIKFIDNNMSDGDFRRLNRKLLNAAKDVSSELYEKVDDFYFTKKNILLVGAIINDEKLSTNKTLIDNLENFTADINNPYQDLLSQKILADDKLTSNPDFVKNTGNLISAVNNEYQYNFALKIISDERLFTNKNILSNIEGVVSSVNTKEGFDLKSKVVDKILSDEKLCNNMNIKQNIPYYISGVNNQNSFNISEKILSDENLYDNKNVVNSLYFLVEQSNTEEKVSLVDTILSSHDLYDNVCLMQNIGITLPLVKSEEQSEICDIILSNFDIHSQSSECLARLFMLVSAADSKEKAVLSKKVLSNDELYKNQNIIDYAANLIMNVKSVKAFLLADKIFSDKNLYDNSDFMLKAESVTYAADNDFQYACVNKIISDSKLYNNSCVLKNIFDIVNSSKAEYEQKTADKILSDEKLYNDKELMRKAADIITAVNTGDKFKVADKLLDNDELRTNSKFFEYYPKIIASVKDEKTAEEATKNLEALNAGKILRSQYFSIYGKNANITSEQFAELNEKIGKEKTASFTEKDNSVAVKYLDFYGKNEINELTKSQKKAFVNALLSSEFELLYISKTINDIFPILPKTQKEYKQTLKAAVSSTLVSSKHLTNEQISGFDKNVKLLSSSLCGLSDEEFNSLHFNPEYLNKEFISDVYDAVSILDTPERQKVFDYFGFELHHNKKAEFTDEKGIGFSLTGYPENSNDTEKLSKISNPETLSVIEKIRPFVVKYNKNNNVTCENKAVEKSINEILEFLPELRPTIGRKQHGSQAYDVFKHSLKVMQKITQDTGFKNLKESDKKVILLCSLLHDITKKEGGADGTHAENGAYDAVSIVKRFNLSKADESKLYTLIKNHEWLGKVNTSKNSSEAENRINKYAYEFACSNAFDMALMFTHADLKSVRADDSFHDTKTGKGRTDFDGNVRSFGESADYYGAKIKEKISELQKSQPFLPVTEFPKAGIIDKSITHVNDDGTTDIKGVYKDKDGTVYIKFNEVEDWEQIGFPKGSISKGIKTTTEKGEPVDTGNIHFFVHALDNDLQLSKFYGFSLPDSQALLSLSYAERPESKYSFFRPQGILIDCVSPNLHGGGGANNMGTGVKKQVEDFKKDYFENGIAKSDRNWVSMQIKGALGMSDEEYVKFIAENSNKSFCEIKPGETAQNIIKVFSSMNSGVVCGNRAYNEIFASSVRAPMAVFAISNDGEPVGNPVEYFNKDSLEPDFGFSSSTKKSPKERTAFLREYALENDLPLVVFGE